MAVVSLSMCTCPVSLDTIVCAKCGGMLPAPSGVLSRIDLGIQQWFYDLDSESRLNSSLAMYMAIDRQIRQGAPITAAVQQAVKEIGTGLDGLREEIERRLTERFNELRGENESSTRLLREAVVQQVESIVREIRSLSEQGKSIAEIETRVREAAGALQTYLTAIRLPGVKGEEGEANVLRDLLDAFLGQPCIRIEPIGGADATDAIAKFYHGEIEIGRSLVEVKARKTWSSEYIEQVRDDMKRYNVALAVLAVDKLPKTAKARGFHIDMEVGVVITTPPELVVPTITMFYEIYAASYRLQKRTFDLESVAADRDLVYYINDNMKILEDCKKISDVMDDSTKKIKEHLAAVSSRLQGNNGKIAQLLSNFSGPRRRNKQVQCEGEAVATFKK